MKKPKPDLTWRVQSDGRGAFDELVVQGWFHIERMNDRCFCMHIGDRSFNIVRRDGKAELEVLA